MGHCYVNSPVGWLYINEEDGYIVEILFKAPEKEETALGCNGNNPILLQCVTELSEYFEGRRKEFTVPIRLKGGTEFRRGVWEELCRIPYGKVISYKELAEKIGNPKAIRAVGGANHNNPISIIVPCHRVIGANGKLVGYGGGLDKKELLLKLEGVV